jgi:cupin fold WbuC family metalloprotein
MIDALHRDAIRSVDKDLIRKLHAEAEASPRRRSHLLLHSDDQVQRLLIVLCLGTYVRPHRHSEQWELLVLVTGEADFLAFSPTGELVERIRLAADRTTLVQISPGQIHGFVTLKNGTAVLEVKPGPYRVNEFIEWAPAEGLGKPLHSWIGYCRPRSANRRGRSDIIVHVTGEEGRHQTAKPVVMLTQPRAASGTKKAAHNRAAFIGRPDSAKPSVRMDFPPDRTSHRVRSLFRVRLRM